MNEEGDVTFNVPQSFATLIRPNFNETCSASAGQKRLGKRYGGSLSEHDVACITNSAFGGVTYAASNAALQTDLLLIPTDFQLGGLLVGAADQVATMIRANARRFNNAVFSPLRIPAIAAFFTGVAWSLWVNGPGTAITQVTIPYSEVEDVAVSSSCSSLTYSWTTPTPSTTVVVSPSAPMTSC